jgi:hypothetical protein
MEESIIPNVHAKYRVKKKAMEYGYSGERL